MITWEEFCRMSDDAFKAKDKMQTLARNKREEDKEEYLRLSQFAIDTASKLLESTGDYTPNLGGDKARHEEYLCRVAKLRLLRRDTALNRHRWWEA